MLTEHVVRSRREGGAERKAPGGHEPGARDNGRAEGASGTEGGPADPRRTSKAGEKNGVHGMTVLGGAELASVV